MFVCERERIRKCCFGLYDPVETKVFSISLAISDFFNLTKR